MPAIRARDEILRMTARARMTSEDRATEGGQGCQLPPVAR
jgi:hypothetical protein